MLLGCYGDAFRADTESQDRLARQRVSLFSRTAYTNSPVCVPARASLAAGRYPHRIAAWDSTTPHDGTVKGWAARLSDAGHDVVSIGKLHYRSAEDPNGFARELIPMHVHNGTGWLSSLLREPPAPLEGADDMAGSIGAGETRYTEYDRRITRLACDWLAEAARQPRDKPWTLYIGLVAPHFPLVAPQEFYDLYADADIAPPRQYAEAERPRHPVLDALRQASNYDAYFDPEKVRIARRGYYGLCSFLDDNIGKILSALAQSGLEETTRVVYASDHGDNLGHRGLWGKSVMYEDSVAVPLIMAGPDIPAGRRVATPASLVDLHPTFTEFAGETRHAEDADLPGASLTGFLDAEAPDRVVFSEYHDWSSITGMFMIRRGVWKLVVYPGYAPQLFDLEADPQERADLAADPAHEATRAMLEAELAKIVDVEAVNRAAFADQRAKIARLGGRDAVLSTPDLGYTPPPAATAADPREP